MKFREATAADEDTWQAMVATSPTADFLHDWAWASVAAFDNEPQTRFVLEENGEIVGLVAAQPQSMAGRLSSWYVPHGPVLDYRHPRAPDRLRAIIAGLRDAGREAGVVVVRLEPRIERDSKETALFDSAGLRHDPRTQQVGQTQILDLNPDEETVFAATDSQTRRKVRRAERDGVTVEVTTDPDATYATDATNTLAGLVRETERRSGARGRGIERIGLAWRELASRGRAAIIEARLDGHVLASGMVVFTGDRSFYLFSGSLREAPGEPKHFPSYAMKWEMIRVARSRGSRTHDLWGIEPLGAGPEHPWHGIGTFKRSFGGRSVVWAGSWDLVLRPSLYRIHGTLSRTRRMAKRLVGKLRRRATSA